MPGIWDHLTAAGVAPPSWVVFVTAAAALAVVVNHGTWRVSRNAITIAHEGGHALVSVLSGRRLDGIRLHADTSGVTYSRGKRTGPGMVLTSAAGYVTPSLLGAGAAWLVETRHVTALLWLMLVLIAATVLAMRNAYGFLAVGVAAAAVFVITWYADARVQSVFGYAAAWFLLLGGVRPVFELRKDRRRTRRTDADQLALLTGLPAGVWVAAFAVVVLGALALGTRLLLAGA
jgi:hypothetical protein